MKDQLLNITIEKIKQLDQERLKSVNNFIESLAQQSYNESLTAGFAKLAEQSETFGFLNNEPDIYSDDDLIKVNE